MKKFISLLLATMLLLVPMTSAFAGDLDNPITGDGSGGSLAPVNTYTQLTEVTLPTGEAFSFVIDPSGLYYMSDEEIEALVVDSATGLLGTLDENDAWQPLETAGQVVFSDYAPYFINNSNFQVAVELGLTFTDGNSEGSITALDDPADIGTANDGDDVEVFIGAALSTANVTAAPTSFSGTKVVPVLAATAALAPLFIFDAANYEDAIEVTRDETSGNITAIETAEKSVKAEDFEGHGTQIVLFGECNTAADWVAIAEDGDVKPSIEVKFTFTAPATTSSVFDDELKTDYSIDDADAIAALVSVSGAYGMVEANDVAGSDLVTLSEALEKSFEPGFILGSGLVAYTSNKEHAATAKQEAKITTAATTGVTVPFNVGDNTVETFAWWNGGNILDLDGTYTFADNLFTVDLTGWPSEGGPHDIWIELSNGDWYILWVDITA